MSLKGFRSCIFNINGHRLKRIVIAYVYCFFRCSFAFFYILDHLICIQRQGRKLGLKLTFAEQRNHDIISKHLKNTTSTSKNVTISI